MTAPSPARGPRRARLASPALGAALLGTVLLAASCASSEHEEDTGFLGAGKPIPKAYDTGFDDRIGGIPEGWRIDTTNARAGQEPARWARRSDVSAPSPTNTISLYDAEQHVGHTYNLCWTPEAHARDVELSVAVRADGGDEDQGGGPAWRIGDADNYYLARWNPLEDNFRVYSVIDGERLQLDSARVRTDATAWHTIRVRHVGAEITCWFDGKEMLKVHDEKLMNAGGAGLWTKADATTRFDDFRAQPLD